MSSIATHVRYRLINPSVFAVRAARSRLRWKEPVRILIASDLNEYTSEQQFAPLVRAQDRLSEEAGLDLLRVTASDALRLPSAVLNGFSAVFVKFGFRRRWQEVKRLLEALRARAPGVSIVYFDGDDDVCVQWPGAIDLSDLYVKKQMFADLCDYQHARLGKSNLTHYVTERFGVSFAEDIVPESPALTPRQAERLVVGWNVAADDKIAELYRATRDVTLQPLHSRPVDICSRAYCPESNWIYPFRRPVIDILEGLRPEYSVLTPKERVPQDEYYHEMRSSKVCFSPFGYGEVCWRDFEAILCGCVLVKPRMDHVRTNPDIYLPDETYVPVRWDMQDLGERLRDLLGDSQRMERFRANAYAVVADYYDNRGFESDLVRVLAQSGAVSDSASLALREAVSA